MASSVPRTMPISTENAEMIRVLRTPSTKKLL